VLAQRDVDFRVLIVDDASPDDTPQVAKRLAAADPRINYIRNEVNLGLVGTINRGLAECTAGDYLVVLSADDALTPGSLARSVQIMDNHPEIGMVYGASLVFQDNIDVLKVPDLKSPNYRVLSGPAFLERTCGHGICLASPSALVRRTIQDLVSGYEKKFPHSCDLEMWMRIATQCSIAVLDSTQALYRWHGQNMSIQYIYRPTSDLQEQIDTATHVQKNWGAEILGFPGWIEAMRIRLANQACWMAGLALERSDPAAKEDCLTFAARHNPALWRSISWWRYQAKRLLGRSLASNVRKILRGQTADGGVASSIFAPFRHGQTFGWWPGAQS
jgi:hypothetical protein